MESPGWSVRLQRRQWQERICGKGPSSPQELRADQKQCEPFGRAFGLELSARNWRQLLVPKGFAHGYQTLTEDSEVLYKVTAPYAPQAEAGLLWNDPALGLAWPLAEAVLNARDGAWPTFAEWAAANP